MTDKVDIQQKRTQDVQRDQSTENRPNYLFFYNFCQVLAQRANTLGGINRGVVCKAMLSAAGVAAPSWAQLTSNRGLHREKAARMVRVLTDKIWEKGVKGSLCFIYRRDSGGSYETSFQIRGRLLERSA